MITIVRGNERIVCSFRTYEDQFKKLGYVIASEPKKEVSNNIEVKVSIKEDAEELVNNIIEEKKQDLQKEAKEQIQEEAKTEEEKIGSKYGVRRRNTTKKEA